MRTLNNKKILAVLLPIVILTILVPHTAHAVFNPFSADDWIGAISQGIGKMFQSLMELIVLPLGALLMSLTGAILDAAMKFSLSSGFIFSNMGVINQVWTIIRDICNLFFIFALIWISISIILDIGGSAKRRLAQVLIAALIINFSLYFTKVFIDLSNIFGVWLYNGVMKLLVINGALNYSGGGSLSALIAAKLDIFQLWTAPLTSAKNLATALADPTQGAITSIIKLLVVLVATYVFMYTAILFLTRAVTIVFLLALSPIGFVGGLLPQLDKYSKQWWSELVDAITFPIVYLLMLFVSLQFINSVGADMLTRLDSGSWKFTEMINFQMIFKYAIVICSLIITLKVAKDSAGSLGRQAGGIADSASKFATKLGAGGLGATAFLGRRTIGRFASWRGESDDLQDRAAGKVGNSRVSRAYNQIMGKATLGIYKKAADSNFDIRSTTPVATAAKAAGVDLGKAYKGGYSQMVKDQEKKDKEYAATFGDTKEGIDRQLAYAKSRESSIFNYWAIGKKARAKNAEKLSTEVGKLSQKAESQEAQKEAQKVGNQLVVATTGANTLKKAGTAVDTNEANGHIDQATQRLDELAALTNKNGKGDRVKLIAQANDLEKQYEEHKAAGRYDQANELAASDDFQLVTQLKKNASKEELADASKIGVLVKDDFDKVLESYRKKTIDTQDKIEKSKKILAEAKGLDNLMAKKNRINDAISDINENIIGKEGNGSIVKENGVVKVDDNGVPVRNWGSGLKGQLSKARSAAKKKKEDSKTYGAEGGGGGGGKKKEDEDEDDEDEDEKGDGK